MSVQITRKQMKRGIKGVHVARGNNNTRGITFAPSWDMVSRWKAHQVTEAAYTKEYRLILEKIERKDWEWLSEQSIDNVVIVLCFCKDGDFCHTLVLIEYALEHFSDLFKKFEDQKKTLWDFE